MSTGKDSRRDPRAKVLSMTVRYKSATVAEFKENHSYDVSRGGLFIKTSSPFPPGTLLKFEVRIAEEQKVMMGVGRVTWKREEAQGPEKPAGMGVKFIKLDDESTRLIDELVMTREEAEAGFEEGARESGVAVSLPPPAHAGPRPSSSDPDKSVIAHTADILRSALDATNTSKAPSVPPDDDDRHTVPNAAPSNLGPAKAVSAAGTKSDTVAGTVSTSGAPRSLPPRPTQVSKPPTSTAAPVKTDESKATEGKAPETLESPEPRKEAAPAHDVTSGSRLDTTAASAVAAAKETVGKQTTEETKPKSGASSKRPGAAKAKAPKREAAKRSSSRPAAKHEDKPKAAKNTNSTLTTTPPRRAQEEVQESEKTSPLLWVMLTGIALAVGYYLFTQNESSKVPEPEPEPRAEPEQAPAEATQPPVDAPSTEVTSAPPTEPSAAADPSATAAAEGTGGAAEPAAGKEPEVATEPETPVAKPKPRPAPQPKRPRPPPPPAAAPTSEPTAPKPTEPVAPAPTSAPVTTPRTTPPPTAPAPPKAEEPKTPVAPRTPEPPTPGSAPSAG